ncbi:hypothetical protein ACTFIV_001854 [Dictyostelium citrinum]
MNFRIINRIGDAYKKSLQNRPVVTKSLTGTVVFFLGDTLAQKIENRGYDPKRTLMMCTIGTFIVVPQIHFWFKYLDKTFTKPGWSGAIPKVIVDQLTFGPYLFVCNMTSVQLFHQGLNFNVQQWKDKMKNDFFPVLQKAWMIWPLTNCILFRFVHPDFRILISNLVSVGWNCILSTVSNKSFLKNKQIDNDNNSVPSISTMASLNE